MNDHFETSKKQKKTQNTSLLRLKVPKIELRIVLEAFFVVQEKCYQSISMRNITRFHLRPFLQSWDHLVVTYWQKIQKKRLKVQFQQFSTQFYPFFDEFFTNKSPPNDPTTIKMVSNEGLECFSMILTKKVFSEMINKASRALNT